MKVDKQRNCNVSYRIPIQSNTRYTTMNMFVVIIEIGNMYVFVRMLLHSHKVVPHYHTKKENICQYIYTYSTISILWEQKLFSNIMLTSIEK